jgi:hypothetical protein
LNLRRTSLKKEKEEIEAVKCLPPLSPFLAVLPSKKCGQKGKVWLRSQESVQKVIS